MGSNSAFTGVAAAGMPRVLHVVAAAAHPAFATHAAAAVTPQRKRRAAAKARSVDRGTPR
jgi:hypothetical protein